ncbi:MAG: TetR/AcrR family transcriptional regulator [Deltaproteobacteria bacterium]|nr:TetR/AcrR family transcriptional regulator [Deltaproteobacteria bacterium]MBN2673649.1 TetR/AcrR family transcriptional regulator [Deltaproteobacteria bacterium]
MTKHRRKEEWISEILEAARIEIDEHGYTEFSMEALVRRTGFSKGGIYRFYKNKADVALELFSESYVQQLSFDLERCVEWNLPIADTIFRLFVRYSLPQEGARRADRIWIRLIPEVLNDAAFKERRAELLHDIEVKIGRLCKAIAERDGREIVADFDQKFSDSFSLSAGLLEGLSVQTALGCSIEHQGALVKTFIDSLIQNLFVPSSPK